MRLIWTKQIHYVGRNAKISNVCLIGLIDLFIHSPYHWYTANLAVYRCNCYLLLKCYIKFCNNVEFVTIFTIHTIKPTKCTNVKIIFYFLHTICDNSNMFHSILIILRELLNINKRYINTQMIFTHVNKTVVLLHEGKGKGSPYNRPLRSRDGVEV